MPTVAMLYDTKLARIGDVSSARAEAYCARHGYRFECRRELVDTALHPSWNKVKLVREHLTSSEWVLWLDADTCIMDMDFDLASMLAAHPRRDLLVSVDTNGLCAGVFAIRNTEWSHSFLDTMLFLGSVMPEPSIQLEGRHNFEQTTMKLLRRSFGSVAEKTHNLPQSIVSNPLTDPRPIKPFIHHYWSSMGHGDVEAIRSAMLAAG